MIVEEGDEVIFAFEAGICGHSSAVNAGFILPPQE